MRANLTIMVAFAAGLLGGLASHYLSPAPLHAQSLPPPPAEIRAQKFVLVDENGVVRGAFGFETNGSPVIEISSDKGHVFTTRWYGAEGAWDLHTAPSIPSKPTLLR